MEDYKKRIDFIKKKLNPQEIEKEIEKLGKESSSPDFWKDHLKATEKMKKLGDLQKDLNELNELDTLLSSGEEKKLGKKLSQLELKTFLSGEYDKSPAIFLVHAGQGGTEAMDWADMLKRMYIKYFEKRDWKYRILEETMGDEAGIKSVTLSVDSPYAYGYLKLEAGTHRLVRQSPFNSDNLRQTSFALVEVLPQIDESPEIEINNDDLDWQFYRASSKGGQNVQKVSSAVRLIHKPTNIVVTCQTQRYQEQNRKIALDLLRAKLWALKEKERRKEEKGLREGKKMAAWGTQIRSYVLHPYKMVKDLRTSYESSNPEAVLDGNLDEFVEAELKSVLN